MTTYNNYNWLINAGTGDFYLDRGNPIIDETQVFPAYARLKIDRSRWMYAPNTDFGSDFYLVKKRSYNTPQLLENMARKALQPMLDDGRLSDIEVSDTPLARHAENISVTITETKGTTQTFSFTPIG